MNLYYHLSPRNWLVGSYLPPGHFGRLIRFYGKSDPLWRREIAYEDFRLRFTPSLPSRLNCLFCMPTVEECELYRRCISGFSASNLFEVQSVEDGFIADHSAIAKWDMLEFAEHQMRAYWSGCADSGHGLTVLREVLLKRGAYVVRRL